MNLHQQTRHLRMENNHSHCKIKTCQVLLNILLLLTTAVKSKFSMILPSYHGGTNGPSYK